MQTFKRHLKNKLKSQSFRAQFDEEKVLADISLRLNKIRQVKGLSQSDLARKSHVTQQQLSKIENGENCNMLTFLRVCRALHLKVAVSSDRIARRASAHKSPRSQSALSQY